MSAKNSNGNVGDKEESNKPDYEEDEDQLEEEHEEQTGRYNLWHKTWKKVLALK